MKNFILFIFLLFPVGKQEKENYRIIKNDVYDLVEVKNGMGFVTSYTTEYRFTQLIFFDSDNDCLGYLICKKVTKYPKYLVVETSNNVKRIYYKYYLEENSIGDLEFYFSKLSPNNKRRIFVP